jgi:HAD superfamily hydrolase (TIGR01459 family)
MSGRYLSGIRSLARQYDFFIIDLWGTVHNGYEAYPGALDALRQLAKAGKQVVFLSNAPRRAKAAEHTLDAVGITPDLYALLATSGEEVHVALRDRNDDWHKRLSGACWHLGPTRDRSIFEGLDLEILGEPDGAGFCVVTGNKMNEEVVEDYRPELDRALALGLPMICANPDLVVPVGDALVVCAGAFAEYYATKGGDVYWHGKPHLPIYTNLFAALETLNGAPVDKTRTIAIGDALATDIVGASVAGIAGALVIGGVHSRELGLNWRGRPKKKALAALIEETPVKPDHVLLRLKW